MTTDYASARANMVDCQIRTNKVVDPAVIDAMRSVPRELFVPAGRRGIAYVDEDIPLADGRFIMEPMVFARLLEAARITPNDAVLDIGCATGYSTAVLSRIATAVVAIEETDSLVEAASSLLTEANVDNAAVFKGRLTEGYAKQAPYDVIVIEGAVSGIPDAISRQLGDGGRLLAVEGADGSVGKAVLLTQMNGVLARRELFDANTMALPEFHPNPSFVF